MNFIEANFEHSEHFQEAVSMWDLDFRILSKNNFSSFLSIYTNQKFQIGRTKLDGKIQQLGIRPKGFRTLVVPVHNANNFIWLNKKTDGKQLLIFPENENIDAVSYTNFDVYVISIEESYLFETIEYLGYRNAKKYFGGSEKQINLSELFVKEFHQIADEFLYYVKSDKENGLNHSIKAHTFQFDNIILYLLRFFENNEYRYIIKPKMRRRDIAMKKAVDLINNDLDVMPTISQLCRYSGISERTLEYAFLEKFQVTPKDYIKATRLNKIRVELLRNNSKDCKISNIALFNGFWHMGQFAADYKKWFGELPSETLKR